MEDPPGSAFDTSSVTPQEAFAVLGNATRIQILKVLWDGFESGRGDNAITYTELFDQVNVTDSGNFSYHLEQLTGPFIRRTDTGYTLRQTGVNVVRAVIRGVVTESVAFDPVPIDEDCPICDAPIEVGYSDKILTAYCTGCEGALRWDGEVGVLTLGLIPPAILDRGSLETVFRSAVAYTFHEIRALAANVCPHCGSSVRRTIDICSHHDPGPQRLCTACNRRHLGEVWLDCTRCKRSSFPPVSVVLFAEPIVGSFLVEQGIDYQFCTWETVRRSMVVKEELVEEKPLRLQYSVPAGPETLTVTLDEELHIIRARS